MPSDPFLPSWGRGAFALGVAIAGFFIPQEVPLEYYPLNNPSSGLNYLEITCAANTTSHTQIFLDFGAGFNELDSILWPIAPSERAYTYTFPLKDAPLHEMRIDPLAIPGELTITNFRIINRREEEIRRFTKDSILPSHEIDTVQPLEHGWKIITSPTVTDPYARLELHYPIVPEGMNERNLKRCLLSWSYLSMMLWIILLAVYFTFLSHRHWPTIGRCVFFLAVVAMLFSAVGNRGLIKNSIRYARHPAPAVAPGLRVEIDLSASPPSPAQFFWDTGRGFNEEHSLRRNYEPHNGLQTFRFDLPAGETLHNLRFDPLGNSGTVGIHGVRIIDNAFRTRLSIPPEDLVPVREIAEVTKGERDIAIIKTVPDATDPILIFPPESVEAINRLLAAEGETP